MSSSAPNAQLIPRYIVTLDRKLGGKEKEEKNVQKRKFNSHVKVARALRKERNFISLHVYE